MFALFRMPLSINESTNILKAIGRLNRAYSGTWGQIEQVGQHLPQAVRLPPAGQILKTSAKLPGTDLELAHRAPPRVWMRD